MDDRMSHRWLAAAALPAEEVLGLRDALAGTPSPGDVASRAQAHAPLLLGLLRLAGLSCHDPLQRPLDARDAVERLGAERARRHLRTLALLLPSPPDTQLCQRVADVRRAAEHLRLRLQEADALPSRLEETVLRLLEWIPVQARSLSRAEPELDQAGPWLVAALGSARGLHPDLLEALEGLGSDSPGAAGARAAALARGVWHQTGAGRPARLDPILLGARPEPHPAPRTFHG